MARCNELCTTDATGHCTVCQALPERARGALKTAGYSAVRAGTDLADRSATGIVARVPRGVGPGGPPGRRGPARR